MDPCILRTWRCTPAPPWNIAYNDIFYLLGYTYTSFVYFAGWTTRITTTTLTPLIPSESVVQSSRRHGTRILQHDQIDRYSNDQPPASSLIHLACRSITHRAKLPRPFEQSSISTRRCHHLLLGVCRTVQSYPRPLLLKYPH